MKSTLRRPVPVQTPVRRQVLTRFRPSIKSRMPSHNCLRPANKHLPLFPYRVLIRLGSVTETTRPYAVEINSTESIRISSNKRRMKEKFTEAGVKTAQWFTARTWENLITESNRLTNGWETKLVAKANYGAHGSGNTLISTQDELREWSNGKNLSEYIFEKFHNYGHEFRLHVTSEGCFYTCRKALRQGTPEAERWRFHDDTSVFLLETNENFQRPGSWDEIVEHCVRALNAIGADVLAFDVKVQTPVTGGIRRPYQDFIILESNSAPSMDNGTGELSICAQKYIEELPRIITRKANRR